MQKNSIEWRWWGEERNQYTVFKNRLASYAISWQHDDPPNIILCLKVRELHSLYIYIVCVV